MQNAQVGRLGIMLLHNACEENGNLAVAVKYLIEQHDCDPSEKDKEGNTPLHIQVTLTSINIAIQNVLAARIERHYMMFV